MLPKPADMRYHWAVVRLAAIDLDEMADIVATWRMVCRSPWPDRSLAQDTSSTTTEPAV